ncbi:MAG: hypothetical protein GXP15_08510 [Gammaproteobacteria bacterium]|nr:hypothetical protein [Gammaproteobacteria bacterium]
MNKGRGILARIRNREYRYIFKRIFPTDNNIFYAGRQVILGQKDLETIERYYELFKKKFKHQIVAVDEEMRDRLFEAFPDDKSKFERRLARGANCYVSITDSQISAYVWVQPPARAYETNSLWVFKPKNVHSMWFFDIYVLPQFRLKGLFGYLSGAVRSIYSDDSPVVVCAETSYNNRKSLRAHFSMGYEITHVVDFVSIFGLKIYLARQLNPKNLRISCRFELNPKAYRL